MELDEANGETIFQLLHERLGDEWARKVQAMLNGGMSFERIMRGMPWHFGPNPQEAKAMVRCCFEWMRRNRPVEPWPTHRRR